MIGFSYKNLEAVVWIQTSFLGDIVLSTFAFNILKAQAPHIKQYVVTTPIGAAILKDHPALEQVVVFPKKSTTMVRAVKMTINALPKLSKAKTVTLQAHRSVRSSLLAWALGYRRITYHETLWHGGAIRLPRVAALHESQRIALLLEPLGIPRTTWDAATMSLASAQLRGDLLQSLNSLGDTIVAVAPGSVWGTKRWPIESYTELVKLLLQQDFGVVLLGSEGERDAMAPLMEAFGDHQRLLDLVGKTSLEDLRGLYSRFSLLVSNDSSPIHFASAFGVRTVAIFGATVPAMGFGPRAEASQVVEAKHFDVPCRPCSDHGPKICPKKHFQCMKSVAPLSVFGTVMASLP